MITNEQKLDIIQAIADAIMGAGVDNITYSVDRGRFCCPDAGHNLGTTPNITMAITIKFNSENMFTLKAGYRDSNFYI